MRSLPPRAFAALAALAARRPVTVLAVAGALVLAGAVLALGLRPSGAPDTLRDGSPVRRDSVSISPRSMGVSTEPGLMEFTRIW